MSTEISPELYRIAISYSREMRKNPTTAEKKFWEYVRKRKFKGLKFIRQHPLFFDYLGIPKFYIADFYCHEKRLVVEIDGKIHEYTKERDKLRTEMIKLMGLKVVRFKNEDVLYNMKKVFDELEEFLTRAPTP